MDKILSKRRYAGFNCVLTWQSHGYNNGYLSDSIVNNSDGSSVEVNWHTNGLPSSAGRLINGKLDATWVFFHENGTAAAREVYDMGRLISKAFYNTEGVQEDTASKDRDAVFPGGKGGWSKFVTRHIFFPSQYKLVNTDQVTVVVTATIDENGNVLDPFVEIPFNKAFDNMAIDIFKKSPKWLPAIRHNRGVVQMVSQPITWVQSE